MILNPKILKLVELAERNRNSKFPWNEYNLFIKAKYREDIENFLLSKFNNVNDIRKQSILSLIFILARINNSKSIVVLLKIGTKFCRITKLTEEILDAIGDLSLKLKSKKIKKEILLYLRKVLKNFKKNPSITSTIGYVLDNLSFNMELLKSRNKKSYFEFSPDELLEIIEHEEKNNF